MHWAGYGGKSECVSPGLGSSNSKLFPPRWTGRMESCCNSSVALMTSWLKHALFLLPQMTFLRLVDM